MKKTPEFIWFNGEIMPWQNATVHVMSHALHYGSSVFEGVRVYNTPKGPAVFRHEEHAQRLFDSAKIYRMNIPFTKAELKQALKDIVNKNGLQSAYIRPLAFLGDVGVGITPPLDAKADVMIAAMEWGAYLGEDSLEHGIDAAVTSWNRIAPNTIPTGAKAGGNYLSSQLISTEAKRHGYREGIALDVNGYLSEGAGENLFIVKNGVIYTPPSTASILPGITRDTLMTLARDVGIEVKEEAISREAMYLADEMFMCGTAAEVAPVRSVDQINIGSGTRGPITKQIQELFFGLFNGSTEDKWGWLDYTNS